MELYLSRTEARAPPGSNELVLVQISYGRGRAYAIVLRLQEEMATQV